MMEFKNPHFSTTFYLYKMANLKNVQSLSYDLNVDTKEQTLPSQLETSFC